MLWGTIGGFTFQALNLSARNKEAEIDDCLTAGNVGMNASCTPLTMRKFAIALVSSATPMMTTAAIGRPAPMIIVVATKKTAKKMIETDKIASASPAAWYSRA